MHRGTPCVLQSFLFVLNAELMIASTSCYMAFRPKDPLKVGEMPYSNKSVLSFLHFQTDRTLCKTKDFSDQFAAKHIDNHAFAPSQSLNHASAQYK